MKHSEPKEVRSFILDHCDSGQIFSCQFFKRSNHKLRKMVCRLGANWEPPEGSESREWMPEDYDLLQVYDMQKQAFRMIPLDRVVQVTAGGSTKVFNKTHKVTLTEEDLGNLTEFLFEHGLEASDEIEELYARFNSHYNNL